MTIKIKIGVKSANGLQNVERVSGTSDPYVIVKLGSSKLFETKVVQETLDPVWDHLAEEVSWDEKSGMTFELWDKNNVTMDRSMGTAVLSSKQVSDGFVGDLRVDPQGTLSISV